MKSTVTHRAPAWVRVRYWPTWMLVGLLRALALLPLAWQLRLGAVLGSGLYYVLRHRRRIAARNIELCLSMLCAPARAHLVRRHFICLGQAVVESASAWWGPVSRLEGLGRVHGLEHLAAAKARGRGVIVISGHFTNVDICIQIMSLSVPAHAVYRRHKNPVLDEQILHGRSRCGGLMIDREDMRGVLKALRANQLVWFSPDQDHGLARHGEFVRFFGLQAATVTTTARLAARTGAAVVPLAYRRLPAQAGYELCLQPALEDFPGADLKVATRRINTIIEAHVLLGPEQYLWSHRRFKTRPPGAPPVYE